MKINKMLSIVSVSLAGIALLVVSACDSGGGGGTEGASTVQGDVDNFVLAGTMWAPEQEQTLFAKIVDDVSELFLAKSWADVPGVQVTIDGKTAVTAGDGLFVISGVTPGTQSAQFTFQGQTASLNIDVPPFSLVQLQGVNINGSAVSIREVEVEIDEVALAASQGNANGNDDNGNDDNGNDDNGNDDDDNGNDDNGNDDDDDDDDDDNSNDNS